MSGVYKQVLTLGTKELQVEMRPTKVLIGLEACRSQSD